MGNALVYLDYNATAPIRPEAAEAMRALLYQPANPSSVHRFGREAKKHLEAARKILADAVSVFTDEVVFTATGSEANAMALKGTGAKRIVASAVEHSSVLKHAAAQIPVDKNGVVDLAALGSMIKEGDLVSVMRTNNETGAIQPIAEVAAICKKHKALFHCDAVQAFGKIPVDFGALGCDMMTLSAHKCGGPLGAAALVARRGLPVAALIAGGGQEMNRRAGTENVAAIAGFAKAIELFDFDQMKKLRGWMDDMETAMIAAGGIVFAKSAPRLPNTTCVAMPGAGSEVQLMDFDLKGFAISAGSACSSGRIEPSHVLQAMGVVENEARCAIRVSGGWQTTQKELMLFTEAWKSSCERLAKAG